MHFFPNDFDGFIYVRDGIEQCTAMRGHAHYEGWLRRSIG
jgi:hypothetical protein